MTIYYILTIFFLVIPGFTISIILCAQYERFIRTYNFALSFTITYCVYVDFYLPISFFMCFFPIHLFNFTWNFIGFGPKSNKNKNNVIYTESEARMDADIELIRETALDSSNQDYEGSADDADNSSPSLTNGSSKDSTKKSKFHHFLFFQLFMNFPSFIVNFPNFHHFFIDFPSIIPRCHPFSFVFFFIFLIFVQIYIHCDMFIL